jgi:hypothetical protein
MDEITQPEDKDRREEMIDFIHNFERVVVHLLSAIESDLYDEPGRNPVGCLRETMFIYLEVSCEVEYHPILEAIKSEIREILDLELVEITEFSNFEKLIDLWQILTFCTRNPVHRQFDTIESFYNHLEEVIPNVIEMLTMKLEGEDAILDDQNDFLKSQLGEMKRVASSDLQKAEASLEKAFLPRDIERIKAEIKSLRTILEIFDD